MKKNLFLLLVSLIAIQIQAKKLDENSINFGQKSLLFMENKGQVADLDGKLRPDILFTAFNNGVKLFFTKDGIYYQFSKSIAKKSELGMPELSTAKTDLFCMEMKLEGANQTPTILREEKSKYYENYYLAHCQQGITNVGGYSRIVYQNIYPNIDWVIYANDQHMKYDFIVHPGGKPADIKMNYKHSKNIKINTDGSVSIKTELGEIAEGVPVCWLNDHEKNVDAGFIIQDNMLQFKLDNYDKSKTLTIDPTLIWSRYFGGSGNDDVRDISAYGDALYFVGSTQSTSGIAIPGFLVQTVHGGNYDSYLLSTDTIGSATFCTYYGSTGNDYGYGSSIINYNGNTCVVMVGSTSSSTGMVGTCGFDNTYAGGPDEGFIAVYLPGGFIFCSSYIGGSGTDYLIDVVSVNPATSSKFYIGGYSTSTSGLGASNVHGGGTWDGFVGRVNMNAATTSLSLEALRYIGGLGTEIGATVKLDASGNVFFAGQTTSTNLATVGAFQTINNGNTDAFLSKLNSNLVTQWTTLFGGTDAEAFTHMTVDAANNPYLVTNSKSPGMATVGAFQTTVKGDYDALLVKFNTSGQRQWSTYFGDTLFEYIYAIDASPAGNIFLGGYTESKYLNKVGLPANPTNSGGNDALLVSFKSNGQLNWSSYYGGALDDECQAIDASAGKLLFAGQTKSSFGLDYLSGSSYAGLYDAFIGKIVDVSVKTGAINNSYLCPGDSVMVPFIAVGDYPAGTIFTAQLGTNNSFINPIILGTTTVATSTIRGYVPLNAPLSFAGNAIRVVCNFGGTFNLNYTATNIGTIGTLPPSRITASGSTAICNGSSVTLNSPVSGNIILRQWFLNGSPISGANAISYSATAAGNYKVKTTSISGCDSTSNIIAVTIKPVPTATISTSGSLTPCEGTTLNLSANTGIGLSYQWYKDGNLISGATASTYGVTTTGSYQVTVTNSVSCITQSSATVATVLPVPIATINTPTSTSICAGSGLTLFANFGPGIFYQWRLNGNNILGANSYTHTATAPGIYTVVENLGNPCISTSSGITITQNPKPTAQVTPAGSQSICQGNVLTLNASTGTSYTYQWFKNLSLINGQTTSSLNVNSGGFYKVRITNSVTSCFDESVSVLVTELNLPPAEITSPAGTSLVEICAGDGLLLTANNAAGVSYQWKKDGIDIVGATLQTYTATATGNYKVKEINSNNCDSTSNIIRVNVNAFPLAAIDPISSPYTCTGNSVSMFTSFSNGFTYKWLKNGVVISGATDTSYTTNQGGSYQVVISNAGICRDTSVATIINPQAQTLPICLSTVDSLSQFNNVIWEKPITTTIDSFRIYREDVTNVYSYIGSVAYNQYSLFVDSDLANANPNAVTKRYRLATVDICGNVSPLSNYHNTLFMSGNNIGTFSWNLYDIDNEPNPVSSYVLYRDDFSTGNWNPVQSTAGTQTQITDPDYFLFTNSRYRLETNWSIACTPTARVLSGFNTSKSNIKNKSVGVKENDGFNSGLKIFPNPASKTVSIKFYKDVNNAKLNLIDALGRIVFSKEVNDVKENAVLQLNLESIAPGTYTLKMINAYLVVTQKLIVE
jgi:hypothetical protein